MRSEQQICCQVYYLYFVVFSYMSSINYVNIVSRQVTGSHQMMATPLTASVW